MFDSKLRIPLEKREDANGNFYYIGKLKSPVQIVCTEGVSFLIFNSIDGEEELQICSAKPNKPNKQKYTEHYISKKLNDDMDE